MAGTVPTLTETLNTVGTMTLSARLDGIVDNFFGSIPLMARLLQQDNIKEEGGKDIRQALLYEKSPGGSYKGIGPFDTAKREKVTELVFDWKMYYVNVTLHGIDMLKNAGAKRIHDLVSSEMDIAEMSGPEYIASDVFGDGTGNDGAAITGLRAAFDNGDTYTTYGGITRSSTAATAGKAASGNVTTTGVTFSLPAMNTHYQTPVIGKEKPDLILTTQALWNKFWDHSQPAQRFRAGDEGSPMASIGFDTIRFNGADVVMDSKVATANIWFCNTKWIRLVVHSKRMWTPRTDTWLYPTNEDTAIRQLVWAGELVVKSPRLQNLLTNVT